MASSSGDGLDFGQSYVIKPTGAHIATIVWLHEIGRTGFDSMKVLESLRLPNIKWICPTAPKRFLTSLGRKTTAWCDVYTNVSESMRDDFGSLNYVNTYVAILLSSESDHVMKGVGGFGLGAAQALFYASAYAFGRIPINLQIVIGINGWLPGLTSLQNHMKATSGSLNRAASLQILLTHEISDNTVASTVSSLLGAGFPTTLKQCKGAATKKIKEIQVWLTENFGLQQRK